MEGALVSVGGKLKWWLECLDQPEQVGDRLKPINGFWSSRYIRFFIQPWERDKRKNREIMDEVC